MNDLIRDATKSDVGVIASLWHDGWHDAHASIVPRELTHLRSRESFIKRSRRYFRRMRIANQSGVTTGLCITKDDELFQMYVASAARGTGLALSLMNDAEQILRARGVSRAWLSCAIGNERAARFYRKCGWEMVRTEFDELETVDGIFSLEIWRFEKDMPS